MSADKTSIAVIGAGIIGLSCAWELTKRGASVTIYEKNWPPRGASWAAAGMLAPSYEFDGSSHWLDLCSASNGLWPGFASDLEKESNLHIDYHSGPSIAVGCDRADAEGLGRLAHMLTEYGGAHKGLSVSDACKRVEGLSHKTTGALELPDDGWVDPRSVLDALSAALKAHGCNIDTREISDLADLTNHDDVLITAGYESQRLSGLAVNAITGVMLAYRAKDFPLKQVIRAGLEYAVPRNEVTIFGATVGDVDAPQDYLMARAQQLFPSLADKQPIDCWTGKRPKLGSGKPVLGQLADEGPFIATGHYRNGILLAPITAKIMADMILEKKVSELTASFSPDSFSAAST